MLDRFYPILEDIEPSKDEKTKVHGLSDKLIEIINLNAHINGY